MGEVLVEQKEIDNSVMRDCPFCGQKSAKLINLFAGTQRLGCLTPCCRGYVYTQIKSYKTDAEAILAWNNGEDLL